jgi:hypothetical protein
MTDIRPLQQNDLPTVVELLRGHLPNWRLTESVLGGIMLDHPWADEELPSLVAVDEQDNVIGFIGSHARRLQFDGEPIRAVCATHVVVAPDSRAGAAGFHLLGQVLRGPQDMSFSDSATDAVMAIWRTLGGYIDYARVCDWMLVLRPTRWVGGVIQAAARREPVGRSLIPVGALPFQAIGKPLVRREEPETPPDVSGEQASTAAIVENLPALTRRMRLLVDYDEQHLDHLFVQVESFWGPVVRRLVRRGERPIGWYAYVLRRGGASRVLQVTALEKEVDSVLGDLIDHAREQGSAVLTGRGEPHLMEALGRRLAVFGMARRPILHTSNPELAAALATDRSLLTRLDGEVFYT